jgi:hypothetical protein
VTFLKGPKIPSNVSGHGYLHHSCPGMSEGLSASQGLDPFFVSFIYFSLRLHKILAVQQAVFTK